VVLVVVSIGCDSNSAIIPVFPVVHGFVVTPKSLPQLSKTIHLRDTVATEHPTSSSSQLSPSSSSPPMKFLRGLRHVIDAYDIFFIDMWGVLHDGKQPYEHVLSTIRHMKQHHSTNTGSKSNKVLILLSNSSKRYHHSITNLQQLGFHVDDFDTVITSGEVTFQMLLQQTQKTTTGSDNDNDEPEDKEEEEEVWEAVRRTIQKRTKDTTTTTNNVFILGSGDDDIPYCTSCGWTPVSNIQDAHLILARGPFTIPKPTTTTAAAEKENEVTMADGNMGYNVIDLRIDGEHIYQQTIHDILHIAADYEIPMIISNPDKVRPDADRSPMPGQIGDLYESILSTKRQSQQLNNNNNNNPTIDVPPVTSLLIQRIGKPFPNVYHRALQSISDQGTIDKSRICMIGDALETDITGGTRFGIDTIWVLNNGVHSIDIQNNLDRSSCDDNCDDTEILKSAQTVLHAFNDNHIGTYAEGITLSPTFVIPYFQW
jgi:ribonucleotide monophosphatase NagD (HAD superfamily)